MFKLWELTIKDYCLVFIIFQNGFLGIIIKIKLVTLKHLQYFEIKLIIKIMHQD